VKGEEKRREREGEEERRKRRRTKREDKETKFETVDKNQRSKCTASTGLITA
jgi:hypothetical protein